MMGLHFALLNKRFKSSVFLLFIEENDLPYDYGINLMNRIYIKLRICFPQAEL